MASGMGIPAIGIYSWELYNFYDVDNIIRIGSAGGLQDDLQLMDIVMGIGACTDSNYAHQFNLNGIFAPTADYVLLSEAVSSKRIWACSSAGSASGAVLAIVLYLMREPRGSP